MRRRCVPLGRILSGFENRFENDQANVRERLRLVEGRCDGVGAWVRETSVLHPDLVEATVTEGTLRAMHLVGGVEDACLPALAHLVDDADGMLDELRCSWDGISRRMRSAGGRPLRP